MRHADVAYFADPNAPVAPNDVVLTPAGCEQARAAGVALRELRFDLVITSGLARTVETAIGVLEQLDRPPADPVLQSWPELQEFAGVDPSLIPDEELDDSFLGPFHGTPDRDLAYCGGETVGSLFDRVTAAVGRLYADPSWETVLIVAHGGTNRAILSWALAGPGPFYAQFEQSPGCINIIDGEPGRFVLRACNVTPYDLAAVGPRTTTVERILAEYRAYRRALA